jgi:hypothetical protein
MRSVNLVLAPKTPWNPRSKLLPPEVHGAMVNVNATKNGLEKFQAI